MFIYFSLQNSLNFTIPITCQVQELDLGFCDGARYLYLCAQQSLNFLFRQIYFPATCSFSSKQGHFSYNPSFLPSLPGVSPTVVLVQARLARRSEDVVAVIVSRFTALNAILASSFSYGDGNVVVSTLRKCIAFGKQFAFTNSTLRYSILQHPSIHYIPPLILCWVMGSWSLSQLTLCERQGTPRTNRYYS